MSDIIDLKEIGLTEALSNDMANDMVSGVIADQITITEQDLKIYTTKNGSPWQQKDTKFLADCILHESIDDAVQYAESKFCTIICVEGETVKWSGGPVKAKKLFSE